MHGKRLRLRPIIVGLTRTVHSLEMQICAVVLRSGAHNNIFKAGLATN